MPTFYETRTLFHPHLSLRKLIWGTLLFCLLTIHGCGNLLGQDDKISDKNEQIIARVKLALVREHGLDAAPIDVKVEKDVVTLNGFVEDEFQREQAVKTAKRVTGVQSVINNIQIK